MKHHPRHILLVEDDPAHAKLLIRQLMDDESGLSVDRVEDGESALQYVRREGAYRARPRPDLILLDLRLPRMSGLDVLHALKADSDLQVIPVVMLTTSDSDCDVIEAYRLGANSYLVKPIDYDQYRRMVRDLSAYWSSWNLSPSWSLHR